MDTKGKVDAEVTVSIRIVDVRRSVVVVEQPDGRRDKLRAGDILRVTGKLHYDFER